MSTSACERCGRTLPSNASCPRHPGHRRLDLRDPDDRAWRDSILALQRRRRVRMGSAILAGAATVGGFVALTRLVSAGTAAHITGEVGMSFALGVVLRLMSEAVVFGGLGWAAFTGVRAARDARRALDPIDRNAAVRRLSQSFTAAVCVLTYALSLVVLSDLLVGVPAELVAAAATMVVAAPLSTLVDAVVGRTRLLPEPDRLLPPEPVGTPLDARSSDPLEQVRRNALRRSFLQRR